MSEGEDCEGNSHPTMKASYDDFKSQTKEAQSFYTSLCLFITKTDFITEYNKEQKVIDTCYSPKGKHVRADKIKTIIG